MNSFLFYTFCLFWGVSCVIGLFYIPIAIVLIGRLFVRGKGIILSLFIWLFVFLVIVHLVLIDWIGRWSEYNSLGDGKLVALFLVLGVFTGGLLLSKFWGCFIEKDSK